MNKDKKRGKRKDKDEKTEDDDEEEGEGGHEEQAEGDNFVLLIFLNGGFPNWSHVMEVCVRCWQVSDMTTARRAVATHPRF